MVAVRREPEAEDLIRQSRRLFRMTRRHESPPLPIEQSAAAAAAAAAEEAVAQGGEEEEEKEEI